MKIMMTMSMMKQKTRMMGTRDMKRAREREVRAERKMMMGTTRKRKRGTG